MPQGRGCPGSGAACGPGCWAAAVEHLDFFSGRLLSVQHRVATGSCWHSTWWAFSSHFLLHVLHEELELVGVVRALSAIVGCRVQVWGVVGWPSGVPVPQLLLVSKGTELGSGGQDLPPSFLVR